MDGGGTGLSELFADFSMQEEREIKERENRNSEGLETLPPELVMNENEQAETPSCLQNMALARALAPALILCCSYLFRPQIKQRFRGER